MCNVGSPFQYTVGKIPTGGSHKVQCGGPGLEKGETCLNSKKSNIHLSAFEMLTLFTPLLCIVLLNQIAQLFYSFVESNCAAIYILSIIYVPA